MRAGFFVDDGAAIRVGAERDGFVYQGRPVTPGFTSIRQPGAAISVMIQLDDGFVATGDCAMVQYAAAGGRDGVLTIAQGLQMICEQVEPELVGQRLTSFRLIARQIDALPVHTAVRYGVSQALLSAVAHSRGVTMAEVVRDEYVTGSPLTPVPMFGQCGDERYNNVDKLILKEVDALPHGLINNVEEKMGAEGELFAAYVSWVRGRVLQLRERTDYEPVLHFDTYGTVALAFGQDIELTADYLSRLSDLSAPFRLRIEQPVDAGGRGPQIEAMARLRTALSRKGTSVEIVADEWCNTVDDIRLFTDARAADVIHVKTPDLGSVSNTIEAILYVKRSGLAAYCGGTSNETDISAVVGAHIAMGCSADLVLAKPGMGVDEGLMIVGNEMTRISAHVGAGMGRVGV